MMKVKFTFLLLAAALGGENLMAKELRFRLDCRVDKQVGKAAPAVARYGIVKDEDYNEFDLDVPETTMKLVGVQGGAIQNHFEWASLTDLDGVGFADCRPRRRD